VQRVAAAHAFDNNASAGVSPCLHLSTSKDRDIIYHLIISLIRNLEQNKYLLIF